MDLKEYYKQRLLNNLMETSAQETPEATPQGVYDNIANTQRRKQEKEKRDTESVARTLTWNARMSRDAEHQDTSHALAVSMNPALISPRPRMESEKNFNTDIGIAFDHVDADGQLHMDQSGMKALQNRRKRGESIMFKTPTVKDWSDHLSTKNIFGKPNKDFDVR